MLIVALEEEVTAFLQRGCYERSQGNKRGYRNGHRQRRVGTGAGEVEVCVPRVAATQESFRSRFLNAWQRRSRTLDEVIPLLYVEGLSTHDFGRAIKPLWGESGLSRSSVSRANRMLKASFANWRTRDLSMEDIMYLFLDAVYLGVRGRSRDKEAIR
jgi:putative transposase